MNKVVISWLLLLLCNFMWALQFTCIKMVQDQVGTYFTVWGPMVIATLLLLPFVLLEKRTEKRGLKDATLFFRLALLGVFPAQVLITWGTQQSTASNAAVISLSLPVITTVFAYVMLKEKMNRLRWMSFIVAIAGVILCSIGDIKGINLSSSYVWGNVLIFLAIVGNAYYNTSCKAISAKYSEMEMVFYTYVAMIVLLAPLVFYFEPVVFARISQFTRETWLGLALLAFFHNFLSMVLFFKALKTLDAMQVALSNYLISFMALPVAAFWLNEKLNIYAIVGGVLVLISTIVVTVFDYKLNKSTSLIKN
ncbi:MAG: DMT family transporter [Agriterribacter sp.]